MTQALLLKGGMRFAQENVLCTPDDGVCGKFCRWHIRASFRERKV
jgi:hypothetical protein